MLPYLLFLISRSPGEGGRAGIRCVLSAAATLAKILNLCMARLSFLLLDVSRGDTLQQIEYWRTELLAKNEENTDLVLMMIGNKVDLLSDNEAKEMHEKGRAYAAKNNMLFEETSAKTGSNVKAAFAKLLSRKYSARFGCSLDGDSDWKLTFIISTAGIYQQQKAGPSTAQQDAAPQDNVNLEAAPMAKKKGCC
jgi:50S ribosomal subunit-associated GTPase HflX